jgi:hypothetical protein
VELDWLNASEWEPFKKHIRVCKILNKKSSPALLLISVWADSYYADKPSGTETIVMPKPLLFRPSGIQVGELPVNFPSDPPSELILYFTNWRWGLPHKIKLCVATTAASGNQNLPPLRYMPATRHYEQVIESSATTKRLGSCHAR